MIPKHARAVNELPLDVRWYLLFYFGSRRERQAGETEFLPSVALAERGVGQADCVLALLRAHDRTRDVRYWRAAEHVIGRRVTKWRALWRPYVPVVVLDEVRPDNRKIVLTSPANPRKRKTRAHYRHAIMRDGMTVQQFVARGGQRRDVRLAVQNGWIQLVNPRVTLG